MTQAMDDEERENRRKPRQFLATTDNPVVSKDVSKEVLQNKQFNVYILRWIDLCGTDGDNLACTNIYYKVAVKATRN